MKRVTLFMVLIMLYFTFGEIILPIAVLLDTILNKITPKHFGLLLTSMLYIFLGLYNLILIKLLVLTFLFILNYEKIKAKYFLLRKALDNLVKLVEIEGNEDDPDLKLVKSINNKILFVENKINMTKSFLNFRLREKVNCFYGSVLQKDCLFIINKTEQCLIFVYGFMEKNTMIIINALKFVPYIKFIFDELSEWKLICNKIYDEYSKDSTTDNNNLKNLGNMNTLVDMLESTIKSIEQPEPTNNFEELVQDSDIDFSQIFQEVSKLMGGIKEPKISLKKKNR